MRFSIFLLLFGFGTQAFALAKDDVAFYVYQGEAYRARVLSVENGMAHVQFSNWIMPSYPVDLPIGDFLEKNPVGDETASVLIEGHRMTGRVVAKSASRVAIEFRHPLMSSVPYVFSTERLRRDASCGDDIKPKRSWFRF